MTLQAYAFDRKGNMVHSGPREFKAEPTRRECRAHERAWRKWRRAYLQGHPGKCPLRSLRALGAIYRVILGPGRSIDVELGRL